MYLKTFLFLHEFWILWEFRILGYFYFYLKPFNYVFLLFSSLHNFRCKAYCHSLLVSLCPVSPPPPWKQLSFLLNCSTVVVCGFAQSSLLLLLFPAALCSDWGREGDCFSPCEAAAHPHLLPQPPDLRLGLAVLDTGSWVSVWFQLLTPPGPREQ